MKFLLVALLSLFTVAQAATWQYATPIATPITGTTAVALNAAATNARNYVTGLQIVNTHATVSSIVTVQDGTTVIWTGFVPAANSLQIQPVNIEFKTPLKGSFGTAMNFKVNTTGSNIIVSAQGYSSL